MEKWVESNFRKFSQDKMKSFTWERRILCNSPGCGLTGWGAILLKKWYSKLHRSHQCTLAGRKVNSIQCCMNRSTVRRLREEAIPTQHSQLQYYARFWVPQNSQTNWSEFNRWPQSKAKQGETDGQGLVQPGEETAPGGPNSCQPVLSEGWSRRWS